MRKSQIKQTLLTLSLMVGLTCTGTGIMKVKAMEINKPKFMGQLIQPKVDNKVLGPVDGFNKIIKDYEDMKKKEEEEYLKLNIEKTLVTNTAVYMRDEEGNIKQTIYKGTFVTTKGEPVNGFYKIKDTKYYMSEKYLVTEAEFNNMIELERKAMSTKLGFQYKASRGGSINNYNIQGPLSKQINGKSGLTLNEVAELVKGTGMDGIQYAVVDNEDMNGTNAFFTLAVGNLESAKGTSPLAVNRNNLFGINAVDTNPNLAFGYETKSECVYDFGFRLKTYYFDYGKNTLDKVNAMYCSQSRWADTVNQIMDNYMRKVQEMRGMK